MNDPNGHKIDGHEYVEIGSIKWATMNIGANSITDYGLYFQWGDTQGYTAEQVGSGEGQKYFGHADYKYYGGVDPSSGPKMTKYNNYRNTVLEASDDAAVANWGGSWRMPTPDEFRALVTSANTTWTQVNNVYGMLFTDKTDSSKKLFFPATGYCSNGSVVGSGRSGLGHYWSNSLCADGMWQKAFTVSLSSGTADWNVDYLRCFGLAVRPVVG